MRELSWLLRLGIPVQATEIAQRLSVGHQVLSRESQLLLILQQKAKDHQAEEDPIG